MDINKLIKSTLLNINLLADQKTQQTPLQNH